MRLKGLAVLALTVAGILLVPRAARAQGDVRLIRPNVMILLDTSGSMEWRNNTLAGECTYGSDGGSTCNRCSNGASLCSPDCPAAESRNRWTTSLEVLTGTINGFSCREVARNDPASYDYLYWIPHHLPLSNGAALYGADASQQTDGILDTYVERVRFGFMTFDNDPRTGTNANDGMYSYGPNRDWRPAGCATNNTMNVGVRRPSADNNVSDVVPGRLISVGPPSADSLALANINASIQTELIGRAATTTTPDLPGLRPYGGTPIAGMLDDVLYYWQNHTDVISGRTGDPYFNCRARSNILITDGIPNLDTRPACEGAGGLCPHSTPDEIAFRMALTGAGNPAVKTYIVAFNPDDTTVNSALTPIAMSGGSDHVYYANDRASLASALSTVLDDITSMSSTRNPPVYGQAGVVSTTGQTLYQFSSGFTVRSGVPWYGQLTRQRTVCETSGGVATPTDHAVSQMDDDDFGYNLTVAQRTARSWGQRYLWTYLPMGATPAGLAYNLAAPGVLRNPETRTELTSTVPYNLFNVANERARDDLLAWLRGDNGTIRAGYPLGDIFHSTPAFVGPPTVNLPDQSFTFYRQQVLTATGPRNTRSSSAACRTCSPSVSVGSREPMIYVGTNDGILHAFNADTGEEVWGFVPPVLVPQIHNAYPNVHWIGVDGSPTVREIKLRTEPAEWHTVLVGGLRQGGSAYFALDVTDPYDPRFLWQFTDDDGSSGAQRRLGNTYGTPGIGTVFYGTSSPNEHAVAILPGGIGTPATSCTAMDVHGRRPDAPNRLVHWTSVGGSDRGTPRNQVNCWTDDKGQYLFVLDLSTGTIIRRLGPTGSPLTGSPALYNGVTGAITTRAYVGDYDGSLWRADFTSRDPEQWWISNVYDLFWDSANYSTGQPIVERPIITVDTAGNILVAFGSGDEDHLEGTDENRIAAFLENDHITPGTATIDSINIKALWELRPASSSPDYSRDLYAGERLTGPMTLFDNVLYFGTFTPQSDPDDACRYGFARLWGVDMQNTTVTALAPDGRLDMDGDASTTTDLIRNTRDINNNGAADDDNTVLFGVGVVRRPQCVNSTAFVDPYAGMGSYTSSTGGDYRLVVQAGTSRTGSGYRLTVTSRALTNRPNSTSPTRVDSWATVFE